MAPQISTKDRLKRFLYTSSEHSKYIVGDPEKHKYYEIEKVSVIRDIFFVDKRPSLLLYMIEIVNSENLLPRRETIFVALAIAATTVFPSKEEHDTFKNHLYMTLLEVCRDDEDLFHFIRTYSKLKKNFSSGVKKAIFLYYRRKDAMEFARDVVQQPSRHGWRHKDVLKLVHGNPKHSLSKLVIIYVLFGLKKAKELGHIPPAVEILNYLEKVEELKRCESEEKLPKLITEVRATVTQVPSHFHKSKEVWEALLPHLDVKKLLQVLPMLYKHGLLKANTVIHTEAIKVLIDANKVKSSKIYPEEVFIALRNFEKGKPMDPKLKQHLKEKEGKEVVEEPKKKESPKQLSAIISAINKTLHLSYNNVHPTGKRIMIAIEISEKMENSCMKTRTVTCLEAALSMTLSILKTEKDVTLAVFNDNQVNIVSFEKNSSFNRAITQLREAKSGYVHLPAMFDWATEAKKSIDVFMAFVHTNRSLESAPKELRSKQSPVASLKDYRRKMNLPQAKLITVCLASAKMNVANGCLNFLDVCGFDEQVPKVIEAFCRGYFC